MSDNSSVSKELTELRQKKRDLAKREKQLKAEAKLEKEIEKWHKIMTAKQACEKIIRDSNIGIRMSLKKLDTFPDYYIYQHPTKTKLKSADLNAEWVQEFLRTGTEAALLAQAKKTRLRAWKRAVGKKKKVNTNPLGAMGGGKKKAVSSVAIG